MSRRAEHEARERQENELRSLGRQLREIVAPEAWAKLGEEQRAETLARAFALARNQMGVHRETSVVWTSNAKQRGYEEATGEIKIPRDDLAELSAEDAAGLVAHEMRHAWQWDVIEGRIDPPGGAQERTRLAQAHGNYDAEDEFKYTHSELEKDAGDRAAYVIDGFRDAGV